MATAYRILGERIGADEDNTSVIGRHVHEGWLFYNVPATGPIINSEITVPSGTLMACKTASATVAGGTMRSRGASGQNCCQMSVLTAPGISATTRIPRSRTSSRNVSVNPRAPNFEAQYADIPLKTCLDAMERLFTIAAPALIKGRAERVTKNKPVRFACMTCCHVSHDSFSMSASGCAMPALLMSMSILPYC